MSLRDTRNTLFSYKNRFNLLFWLTAPLLTYLLTDLRVYMVGLWWRSVVKTGRSSSFVVEQQSILAQLTMSHLNHVTHLSIDQWPTWPVTRDPVPSSCREHNVQLRWDYKYSAWWRFNINFIHLTRCQTRDWYHHSRTAWLTDNRSNNKHVTKWPTDTLTHWPSDPVWAVIDSEDYVLGGQISDVVALTRYVDVDPDGALANPRHARVINERLVHRIYDDIQHAVTRQSTSFRWNLRLFIIIIIIITDVYSAFRSEDTEALDAAQED